MKSFNLFSFATLVCLLLCASFTKASTSDEWTRVRSRNFQLIGNAADKDIRSVAVKLEQFREVFRRIFSQVNFNSPVATNVVVFRDEASFRNFKPVNDDGKRRDWVAGYFQSGEDTNYIVLSAEGEKAETYRTIFHEYIHFLVNNNIGRVNIPPWFNEGLAEYYSTFQIESDQIVSLGTINKKHLSLLQKSRLMPLETFFNIDNYTLQRQGNDGAGLFYARAWALMHFLMQSGDGTRNRQLNKFIDLVTSGKEAKQAFGETFGFDYATMESELKKYIEQKNYRTTVINLKEKLVFDREMQTSNISEAEAKTVLGDLLYHTNRLPEAAALLEEALKLDAGSGAANAALGLVKMRQQNLAEAENYLEKAVALDGENYLTLYRYAYVLSREGMTKFGFVSDYDAERAEKMRAALKKAIRLNPNFAESYNLYAFVSAVRNESTDEALDYVNKALKLAPGNQWYLIRAAELYSHKNDFVNARRIAQKVFQTAPDDELRVYAQNTINNINFLEAQLENLKNFSKEPPTDVTDRQLTEEELALLNEKALIESINRNLRRPKANEKRILGFLTKIECRNDDVIYSVKAENQNLRLRSDNFDSLYLMSYDRQMAEDEVGCGTIKKEHFAVIIYRASGNASAKSAGEIVSVEFVPQNFKLIN